MGKKKQKKQQQQQKTLIAPVWPLIIIVIATFYIKLSVFFLVEKGTCTLTR